MDSLDLTQTELEITGLRHVEILLTGLEQCESDGVACANNLMLAV